MEEDDDADDVDRCVVLGADVVDEEVEGDDAVAADAVVGAAMPEPRAFPAL